MKAYSLDRRKTGLARTNGARKLTKFEVVEIRKWVRTEGYGLTARDQAHDLSAVYHVSENTILDVIANRSWFDPAYDPSIPLFLPTNAPPEWIAWLLSLVLFWRTVCSVNSSNGCSVRSTVTLSN